MQIEEVGVWVCNVARKTRRVGETSRYFTIILSPTVVAVAAKSSRKKKKVKAIKVKWRDKNVYLSYCDTWHHTHFNEAKIHKMRKIVSDVIRYGMIHEALMITNAYFFSIKRFHVAYSMMKH